MKSLPEIGLDFHHPPPLLLLQSLPTSLESAQGVVSNPHILAQTVTNYKLGENVSPDSPV